MIKWIKNKLTNNSTEVPLFWVNINMKAYKKIGKKNSCMSHIHPNFRNDEVVIESLNKLIDYIRDNYDMEKL
ncbi:hypothetical protein [Clostridium sp.]|uniref:hypothetical protein n=1 Tax=Clostridium sp. TaxID=1506 RepID=UPI001A5FF4FD|nr:hypothetical protein [Clostridium sp.]MBK5239859.1 hypothetical protein [Clostridium sp.]